MAATARVQQRKGAKQKRTSTVPLHIATLNVMLVPTSGNIGSRAEAAAAWLLRHASHLDVLVLTEVMDSFGTHKLSTGLAPVWRFQVRPLEASPPQLVNGGVMIASKWPLTNICSLVFQHTARNSDALSAKGAVSALVHNPLWKTPMVVVGTHLQSGAAYHDVRRKQLLELQWLVQKHVPSLCGAVPCVVAGDFNFDVVASKDLGRLGMCRVPSPPGDGVSYDLESNALAAARAEHDDTTAVLDAIAINQCNTRFVFHACCRIVRPRQPDGNPFTDHEALVAVVLPQPIRR